MSRCVAHGIFRPQRPHGIVGDAASLEAVERRNEKPLGGLVVAQGTS